jgi:hypothetical protein
MNKIMLLNYCKISLPLMAALSLIGCSSAAIVSDVTTFHDFGATTQFSGSVFVKPAASIASDSLEFQTYASQITADLEKHGFSQATSEKSAHYVALLEGVWEVGVGHVTSRIWAESRRERRA